MDLREKKEVYSNEEAALLDLGDGIACMEYRSKGNSISPPVKAFMRSVLEHRLYDFDGMVIGSQKKNFSVGANLYTMKENIDKKSFGIFEDNVRTFEEMSMMVKYSKKPIVAAPYRMTLGGGCEIAIHAHARVALSNAHMGLVEVGVGLLPGGGGTKESALIIGQAGEDKLDETLEIVFEKLVCGKVSKDADHARELRYLKDSDVIVKDQETLLDTAKMKCLDMVKHGFQVPVSHPVRLPGKVGYDRMIAHGEELLDKGVLSSYDMEVGKQIALILAGSDTQGPAEYTEEEILKQERECFTRLTMQKGTYERISYFLETNEKLRN